MRNHAWLLVYIFPISGGLELFEILGFERIRIFLSRIFPRPNVFNVSLHSYPPENPYTVFPRFPADLARVTDLRQILMERPFNIGNKALGKPRTERLVVTQEIMHDDELPIHSTARANAIDRNIKLEGNLFRGHRRHRLKQNREDADFFQSPGIFYYGLETFLGFTLHSIAAK